MKIAIAAYVDWWHDSMYHVNEANLMTYTGQVLDDRFEFVLFTHPLVINQIVKRPNVRVIPYCVGDIFFRPRNELEQFYMDLPFAKSNRFIVDNQDILMEYDYVIRTDCDVLFTPTMNDFKFDPDKIVTGLAMQLHFDEFEENFLNEMRNLAVNKLNKTNYKYLGRICTTTIGRSKDIIDIFKEADYLTKDIAEKYTSPDTGWHDGLWHWCSSQYASEIVISSNYAASQVIIDDRFDAPSDEGQIPNAKPWHYYAQFHCRHDHTGFSKFLAREGAYDDAEYMEGDSITAYCLNQFLDFRKSDPFYPPEMAKELFNSWDGIEEELYEKYSHLKQPLI